MKIPAATPLLPGGLIAPGRMEYLVQYTSVFAFRRASTRLSLTKEWSPSSCHCLFYVCLKASEAWKGSKECKERWLLASSKNEEGPA